MKEGEGEGREKYFFSRPSPAPPFLDSSQSFPVKHPKWRHINTIDIYRAFGCQITPALHAIGEQSQFLIPNLKVGSIS